MPLPILESPKYNITIPSTGKIVEIRPFLVKEEKILLIAQESGENSQMISAMKEVISACTFQKINPDELTTFDLEYIFLKLRAKSVGENTTLSIKCNDCDHKTNVTVNIDEITVLMPEKVEKTIMLTKDIGVNMRYIKTKDIISVTSPDKSDSDILTELIIASIEAIFDESKIYPTENSNKDELVTFINSLNREQLNKIQKFIESTPKLEKDIAFTCSSCKCKNSLTLSGVQSFFD
jgi:hypothetical protein